MDQVHNLKRGRRSSGGSPIIRKLKKFGSSFSIKIPAADDEDAYQSNLDSPRTPRATDSPIMRGMKTLARRLHVSKWRLSFAGGTAVPTQSGIPAKARKEWKRAPCSAMSGPLAPRDEAVAFNWNDACAAQQGTQVPFGDADEECDGFVARTRRGSSAAVAVGVAGLCALAEVAGSPFRASRKSMVRSRTSPVFGSGVMDSALYPRPSAAITANRSGTAQVCCGSREKTHTETCRILSTQLCSLYL